MSKITQQPRSRAKFRCNKPFRRRRKIKSPPKQIFDGKSKAISLSNFPREATAYADLFSVATFSRRLCLRGIDVPLSLYFFFFLRSVDQISI
ncbi:hypothetical protein CEXT_806451 [Caerostris extrusa]|uniref:Uncharacterized protein n=1 Tax=Caerostris extrusa TaxID=172846 RepID=A0AAV4UCM2_CAEEX|nr:hypothetical protein CEXT_806451 [Caerostris extrusa]